MTIDITAHLRRLVLAGLPVLANACQPTAGPSGAAPPPTAGGAGLTAACRVRAGHDDKFTGSNTRTIAVGFDAKDTRVSDLYAACVDTGDYCRRLCSEVFGATGLKPEVGHQFNGPHACELGCDAAGRPVARLTYSSGTIPAVGRRPEGFAGVVPDRPGTPVADFFVGCAELEGASIAAFQILALELEHHGAPAALIDRARVAARDETRHFKLAARLARRFGAGRVRCPRVTPRPPRQLLAVALENATEGCVAETFSAAVALHQAATAADPQVRATMAAIAEDELQHAQLAWDVHRWAIDRLGLADQALLAIARAEAGRRLLAGAGQPVAAELVLHAGLPDAAQSASLAAAAMPLWTCGPSL